ncbi:MAG: hypothetical protein KDI74_01300 [Gammaproteobacteria bacterium]|nr:hypothetical protein [Gammaproteobacteria bacterium]
MDLRVTRILLALSLVTIVYLLFSDDDQVVTELTEHQLQTTKPAINQTTEAQQYRRPQGGQYQGSPAVPPKYSSRFGQRPGADPDWSAQFPESHFRSPDQRGSVAGGYQPEIRQPQPNYPTFSYGPPSYDYPDYRYPGQQTLPNAMMERFRPLDEQRKTKRWHGNYQRMSTWPEQLASPDRSAYYLRLAGQQ